MPPLARLRATYSEFADKRARVQHGLSVVRSISSMKRCRAELETASVEGKDASVSDGDLPSAVAEEFAQGVESLLQSWHFPDAQGVYFDLKTRDLMVAGKHPISRGKGLRAITHAAFTIGILDYCRRHATPLPGFVCAGFPLVGATSVRVDKDVAGPPGSREASRGRRTVSKSGEGRRFVLESFGARVSSPRTLLTQDSIAAADRLATDEQRHVEIADGVVRSGAAANRRVAPADRDRGATSPSRENCGGSHSTSPGRTRPAKA